MSLIKTIRTRDSSGEPFTIRYGFDLEQNYFTVTGHTSAYGGCCHDEILAAKPELGAFVALHLSDREGRPMYALANGWYWLAGALGGADDYTGLGTVINGKTADAVTCLQVFAKHCRISFMEALTIRDACCMAMGQATVEKQGYRAACRRAKKEGWQAMTRMFPLWKAEAEAALAILTKD